MTKTAATYQIGEMVKDEGVYAGIWRPKDRNGKALRREFHLFAAPHDLHFGLRPLNYNDTVEQVSKLRNYNGHNGANFADERDLYLALKTYSYNGEWFIPPKDILISSGKLKAERISLPAGTLYDNQDKGTFSRIFNTTADHTDTHKYWSCSIGGGTDIGTTMYYIRFTDGDWGFSLKNHHDRGMSCRLVRAIPTNGINNPIALASPLKLKPPVRFKA